MATNLDLVWFTVRPIFNQQNGFRKIYCSLSTSISWLTPFDLLVWTKKIGMNLTFQSVLTFKRSYLIFSGKNTPSIIDSLQMDWKSFQISFLYAPFDFDSLFNFWILKHYCILLNWIFCVSKVANEYPVNFEMRLKEPVHYVIVLALSYLWFEFLTLF